MINLITVQTESLSFTLASLDLCGGSISGIKPDDSILNLESTSLRDRFSMILVDFDIFSISVMKYNNNKQQTVRDVSSIFTKLDQSVQEALN